MKHSMFNKDISSFKKHLYRTKERSIEIVYAHINVDIVIFLLLIYLFHRLMEEENI